MHVGQDSLMGLITDYNADVSRNILKCHRVRIIMLKHMHQPGGTCNSRRGCLIDVTATHLRLAYRSSEKGLLRLYLCIPHRNT